jgi:beta-glucanase (GH16 family)
MFGTILLAAAIAGSPQGLGGKSDSTVVKAPFKPAKWKLVWSDEFDRGKVPNPKNWNYEKGFVRNGEAQFYTADRRENARIEGGRLVIEARKDNWQGNRISSASLTTSGKRSFLYGRIEARAKIPTGRGTWPAVWMLGENIGSVGWPKCGEIDILENVGYEPRRIHANIHVDAYNHTKGTGKGNNIDGGEPWKQFHTYAVEWYPDRMEFFYDDLRYFVYRKERSDPAVWPFDQPHFLILNLAIGGAWGGNKGIDEALLPHRYEIDYVRHYQRKSD